MKFDVKKPICAAFLAAGLGAIPIWAQANAPSSGTTGGQTSSQPGGTYQGSPGGTGQTSNQPGGTYQGSPGSTGQTSNQPGGTYQGSPGSTAQANQPGGTYQGSPGSTGQAANQPGTQYQQPGTQPGPSTSRMTHPGMKGTHGIVPSSITRTGELGEHIYDSAMVNDWTAANKEVKALRHSTSQISHHHTATVQRLHTTVAALDKDVARRDKQATMRDANKVTLIVAELSHPYNPAVPTDIARLDYYGRQLQIWSTTGNMAELRTTARDMRNTWHQVRPEVESRGATTTARNFDQVVSRIDSAKTPQAYRSAARSALNQVDNLERVFITS